jgi:hypothetical protein
MPRTAGPRISPEGVVAEERQGKAVADIARESGIEHLVYSSLNGASARSGIPAEHPGLMLLETWLRETGWKP